MTAKNPRACAAAWRERHKALGLCINCNEPAEPGVSSCARHRNKYTLKPVPACVDCGEPCTKAGARRCVPCSIAATKARRYEASARRQHLVDLGRRAEQGAA